MKFLGIRPLFLCSVFGLQALLGSNAAWAFTASKLFDSPPKGKDGNCDSRDVDMMVTEAATLAQNAINALDTLLADDVKLNTENKILANTALSLWGIEWNKPWFKDLIKIKSGSDTLSTAKDNYQLVLDKLSSNSVDGARLVCGDKDWKWVVTLGDLGQTPEDKLISDDYNQDASDNPGYYLSKHFSVMVPSEKLKSGFGGGLCTDSNADAETWHAAKYIMMCDGAFDSHTDTLASIIAEQSSIAKGTSLDEKQTAGAVFLHEMMHWIDKGVIDVPVTLPDGKLLAYGFDLSAGIARHEDYVGKAVKNADNYRSFAMAVSLTKVDFSEGTKA